MGSRSIAAWRLTFIVGGILVIAGGSQHPQGQMADMLVDPAWIPSHAAMAVGFIVLTFGLASFRRLPGLSALTLRWAGIAFFASVLESVEAFMHTIAAFDAAAFSAGESTPIFTAHIWMASAFWTVYAVAIGGLIVAGVRDRSLGSPWIAWIGLIGAVAHGTVMWLAVWLDMGRFGILFPMITLIALWFVLAGLWPRRHARPASETT